MKERSSDAGYYEIDVELEGDLGLLEYENGGHRIQRVPPTERRGRVHTSTVTVAVLDTLSPRTDGGNDSDFYVEWFSGSGAGGQHRNKHQNCCRVRHVPTGITRTSQGREREKNYQTALAEVKREVSELHKRDLVGKIGDSRRGSVGSGMRGDKTVTLRFQDDRVTHHVTGKVMTVERYMRGYMDELWT